MVEQHAEEPIATACRRRRKPGQYSDGHPLDDVQYLECKLILKPDPFTAAKVFLDYGKLVAKRAKEFGVGFSNKGVVLKPAIREVVFLDTADLDSTITPSSCGSALSTNRASP